MVRVRLFGTRRRWTAALVVAGTVASACPAPEAAAADDVITPVVATAIAPPAPVLGADGLRHFAYELELVNPAPVAVTIRRIDALMRGRVVDTLRSQDLARHMSRFGASRPGRTLCAGLSLIHI